MAVEVECLACIVLFNVLLNQSYFHVSNYEDLSHTEVKASVTKGDGNLSKKNP